MLVILALQRSRLERDQAVKISGVRNLAFGILVLAFVGCSSTGVPTGQSATIPIGSAKVRPAASCGEFTVVPGANGPYTVGVGDSCVMNVGGSTCVPDQQSGDEYSFMLVSGGDDGTLKGGALGDASATFKRTAKGTVVLHVLQWSQNSGDNCKPGTGGLYATITLD